MSKRVMELIANKRLRIALVFAVVLLMVSLNDLIDHSAGKK